MVDVAAARNDALDLRLRPPRLDDEAVVRAAQHEMTADNFTFAFDLADDTDWGDYVVACALHARGMGLRSDWMPETFLLATVGNVVVGRTSIRHELSDHLLATGGHIGYGVRPAFRRRGYASEILKQSLIIARALGVDRALLTCDEGNVSSAVVITRHGGVLDAAWPRTDDPQPVCRYWIA